MFHLSLDLSKTNNNNRFHLFIHSSGQETIDSFFLTLSWDERFWCEICFVMMSIVKFVMMSIVKFVKSFVELFVLLFVVVTFGMMSILNFVKTFVKLFVCCYICCVICCDAWRLLYLTNIWVMFQNLLKKIYFYI